MAQTKFPAALQLTEADTQLMLAASTHIGARNCDTQMKPYVWKRRSDGIHIINIGITWQKLVLAARIIAAVENPQDVVVISSRPYGHRAVLKYGAATGAQAIAGRFTPGNFTNYITRSFKEPRLIVVNDSRTDGQAVRESSYSNIPVIALCDTDASLKFVDVAIPGNNKSKHSIGLLWWLLAREVLRIRGTIPRQEQWATMPDMFFFRDPEDVEREAQQEAGNKVDEEGAAAPAAIEPDWQVSGNAGLAAAATSGIGGNVDSGLDWAADASQSFLSVLQTCADLDPQLLLTGLHQKLNKAPDSSVSHPARPLKTLLSGRYSGE
ncbi:uncharacterized protein L969DRAFT_54126 [Mixia osmundae IAM 14324]|uniref:Small ribosomal subunit protein uS2 n=1 Tax=Mixia osmundae (strain CBS 9802 / IAM 14324 / JCM 22182 / KY 12970) TaxID=764103 RepID=G7E2K0_MIXOS|nr:uncharacterized protein L969DRAFT_54126 [Mixia osmundae IAM 14324]KEI36931.1 hypothetical protein L969DRAFT_54126 [Mixia osmundae IAM 14324]GAA97060.1 hypothetical protein E5Q_03736 [Mixia osmundae IAM 14324]